MSDDISTLKEEYNRLSDERAEFYRRNPRGDYNDKVAYDKAFREYHNKLDELNDITDKLRSEVENISTNYDDTINKLKRNLGSSKFSEFSELYRKQLNEFDDLLSDIAKGKSKDWDKVFDKYNALMSSINSYVREKSKPVSKSSF